MRSAARLMLSLRGRCWSAACGKKKPPVARPAAAAADAPRRRRRRAAAAPPEPVREPTDRAARAGARRRDRVGVARRSEPQLAAEAGVLRVDSSDVDRRGAAGARRERRAAEAICHLDRDDRRTLRRARDRRVQSGIGRAPRGRGARLPGVARHLRPIGCARSATARSSRSTRDTTKRRARRTAARISSSPRSEQVMTQQTFQRAFVGAGRSSAPSRRRRRPPTKNTSR